MRGLPPLALVCNAHGGKRCGFTCHGDYFLQPPVEGPIQCGGEGSQRGRAGKKGGGRGAAHMVCDAGAPSVYARGSRSGWRQPRVPIPTHKGKGRGVDSAQAFSELAGPAAALGISSTVPAPLLGRGQAVVLPVPPPATPSSQMGRGAARREGRMNVGWTTRRRHTVGMRGRRAGSHGCLGCPDAPLILFLRRHSLESGRKTHQGRKDGVNVGGKGGQAHVRAGDRVHGPHAQSGGARGTRPGPEVGRSASRRSIRR